MVPGQVKRCCSMGFTCSSAKVGFLPGSVEAAGGGTDTVGEAFILCKCLP